MSRVDMLWPAPHRDRRCPVCGSGVTWSLYDQTPGATAPAICERLELAQYGRLGDGVAPCEWRGTVRRTEDRDVEVVAP